MLVLSRASKIEYVSNKHIVNLTLCEQRCSQMITLQKEEEEKMRKQRGTDFKGNLNFNSIFKK